MLSCSIWFCAPNFWIGGGLESRCVVRVDGADGAVRHHPHLVASSVGIPHYFMRKMQGQTALKPYYWSHVIYISRANSLTLLCWEWAEPY